MRCVGGEFLRFAVIVEINWSPIINKYIKHNENEYFSTMITEKKEKTISIAVVI